MVSCDLHRLLPVLCSFVAFILVMLALFAGHRPGVLEEHDIISVNTSGLGKDLVNKLRSRSLSINLGPTPTTDNACGVLGGVLSKVCDTATGVVTNNGGSASSAISSAGDAVTSAVANAGDKINDKVNDLIDKLTEKLHIRDFYSLHALAICEGDFTADGTRNVTECHPYFSGNGTTIPSLLNDTLSLSLIGLDLPNPPTLSSLGLTAPLASALESLNTTLKAFAVIYCIVVGLTGLSFLCCIAGAFVPAAKNRDGKLSDAGSLSVLANLFTAGGAMFFLVLGGLVATIEARVAAGKISEMGDGIGVGAAAGMEWVKLAWVAVGLMAVVLGYWTWELVRLRKRIVKGLQDGEGHEL